MRELRVNRRRSGQKDSGQFEFDGVGATGRGTLRPVPRGHHTSTGSASTPTCGTQNSDKPTTGIGKIESFESL